MNKFFSYDRIEIIEFLSRGELGSVNFSSTITLAFLIKTVFEIELELTEFKLKSGFDEACKITRGFLFDIVFKLSFIPEF